MSSFSDVAEGTGRDLSGRRWILIAVAVALVIGSLPVLAEAQEPKVFEGPVDRAKCVGKKDRPETALQGEVTVKDRESGRSAEGYSCNLEIVGHYGGSGTSWQMAWYDECAYYGTSFQDGLGVQVIDASKPTKPKLAGALTTPSMQDPWESLKAVEERGLLASVAAWNGFGPVFYDVYDVSEDCANPELKASLPVNIPIGHEGDWAPDGNTYYGAALFSPTITAIDTSIVDAPHPFAELDEATHGLSVSDDGTRLYLAAYLAGCGTDGNGLKILDVSMIQDRTAPVWTALGSVCWTDGSAAQHTIPVTIRGKPYVIFVDEGGYGMARIIDISDEMQPFVVSKLKLEIDMEGVRDRASEEASGSGSFDYNAHYCSVPKRKEPKILACSYFQSGVRIFDIRNPFHPKEIAYYNVGGDGKTLPGTQNTSGGTTAYASAQVRIVPKRSEIWFTDQNRGFYVARFADDPESGKPIWPFGRDKTSKLPGPKVHMGASDYTPRRGDTVSFRTRLSRCNGHQSTVMELRRSKHGRFEKIAAKKLSRSCKATFKVAATWKEATFKAIWPKQDDDHRRGRSWPQTLTTHM